MSAEASGVGNGLSFVTIHSQRVRAVAFLAIPNLCRNTSLLLTLLVGQVLTSAVWLLLPTGQNLASYGLYSLYVQTMLLFSSAVLCMARAYVETLTLTMGVVLTTCLVVSVTLIVELAAQWLSYSGQVGDYVVSRFAKVGLATSIIFLLITRFFSLLAVLDMRSKAEAEARIIALQAKIQPHFLFNSLNTISELTQESPEDAESAIHSLSILFRASLESSNSQHSVANEISLCKRYLELEAWRFDDDLKVSWNIVLDDSTHWLMPKLLIQPLVENALKYGRQENGHIDVSIDIRETKSELSFLIENSKGSAHDIAHGNGIAIENIRERLVVLYDDRHVFKIRNTNELYSALIRLPKAVNSRST